MGTAGEAGVRRILAVVDLLIDAADEEALVPALLPLLLRAVPGDSVAWAANPDPAGRVLTHPHGLLDQDVLDAFAREGATDPLVAHTTFGDGSPMRRADLQTERAFHALPVYRDVYRPIGADHQLAMAFPAGYAQGLPRRVCVAFNRGGAGRTSEFTDADVAAAELLRGRLSRALGRLAPEPDAPAPRSAPVAPERPPGCASLTPRERAVLDLLARGLTNQQIAHALTISPRTVDKHLEHAYGKLAVSGRVDAANLWQGRV